MQRCLQVVAPLHYSIYQLEIVKPSQLIMLVILLFEIYLNIMGSKFLRVKFNDKKLIHDTLASQMSQEICSMFPPLKFPKVKECKASNKTMFNELLATHGHECDLPWSPWQDYDRVIRLHIKDWEFLELLQVL